MKNIFTLLILGLCFNLGAQNYWRHFTVADGLPNNIITDIKIISQTNIWIGTPTGLSHFDGRNFNNYSVTNSNIANDVIKQIEYSHGNLFLVTNAGLSIFDGTTFYNFTSNNGLIDNNIQDIATDTSGNLWIASLSGVCYFDGNQFTYYTNKVAYSIAVDTNNYVYILRYNSLFNIPGGPAACQIFDGMNWTSPTMSPFSYYVPFPKIKKSKSGEMLITGRNQNYFLKITYPFNVTRINPKEEGRTINNISEVEIDSYAKTWLCTTIGQNNLYKGSDSTFLSFPIVPIGTEFKQLDVNDNTFIAGDIDGIYLSTSNINPKPVHREISVNNIRTTVNNLGSLFSEEYGNNPGFEMPKGSGNHGIYNGRVIVLAKAANNSFFIAHPNQPYRFHHIPGPVSSAYSPENPFIVKVSLQEIQTHISQYANPSYVMPDGIENWPANGDTSVGVAFDLAPFIDINGNGCYEPTLGDYPKILGDEAIFWINHPDDPNLPLEYHGMLYGYNSSTDTTINNSLFLKYTIVNRGLTAFDSIKAAIYLDQDVGNPSNDYVGCDTINHAFYAYNGTIFDQQYGANVPSVGVKFLSDPMESHIYYTLSNGVTGDPQTDQDWFNYLNGKWKNGQPTLYGGDGYSSPATTNIPSKFMYSGDPYNETGWTERHPGLGEASRFPGDRRSVASMPYFSLNPGQRKTFDISVGYGLKSATTAIAENVPELIRVMNHAKMIYDNTAYSGFVYGSSSNCLTTDVLELKKTESLITMYPNPANDLINLRSVNNILKVEFHDARGILVLTKQLAAKEVGIQLPENLPKGLYVVRVMDETLQWKSLKLVLSK